MDSIKTNLSELLAAFNSGDSITFLTAFLATAFIGWLMGYLWEKRKMNALKDSLTKKEQEKNHFKSQFDVIQDKYALQEADLKKVSLELTNKSASLETVDAEKRTLNSRLNAALLDLDKSKEDLQETSGRVEDLNDQILGLRTKNAQLSATIEENATVAGQYSLAAQDTSQHEQEVADLTSENTLLKNSIAALKANIGAEGTAGATLRISELEQENEQLKEQVEALPQYESGNEVLNHSIQALLTENEGLTQSAEEVVQYEAGHAILNATIIDLIEKNEVLEAQLANQVTTQIEWSVDESDTIALDTEDVEEMDAEEAKVKFRAAIGEQITQASAETRDELKQINGIGPFIEEKLNDLGIYTFEQISQLDEELIETLTNAIEFFPGRIERDDWVGQADRLFYTKGNTPQEMNNTAAKITTRRYATATERIELSSAPSISRSIKTNASITQDNLKKIEGIGPKIAEILNNAGIYTFTNLSQTPVDQLKGILAEAGNRYKLHNPQTWPQQAALAAAGEWEELKTLQDRLDGGRDVAKA